MTDLEKTIRFTNAISSTIEILREAIANHEELLANYESKLVIMLENTYIAGLKESIAVLQHEVGGQLPQLAYFQASGIDTGNAFDLMLD